MLTKQRCNKQKKISLEELGQIFDKEKGEKKKSTISLPPKNPWSIQRVVTNFSEIMKEEAEHFD